MTNIYNREPYDFTLNLSQSHLPISTVVGRRVQESSNCHHHQNVTSVDEEYQKCFEGQYNYSEGSRPEIGGRDILHMDCIEPGCMRLGQLQGMSALDCERNGSERGAVVNIVRCVGLLRSDAVARSEHRKWVEMLALATVDTCMSFDKHYSQRQNSTPY